MDSRDRPRMSASDELRYCRNALADALAERDALQARNATLADTIAVVRAMAERGYVSRDPRGPFAGFLTDLRRALGPKYEPGQPGYDPDIDGPFEEDG